MILLSCQPEEEAESCPPQQRFWYITSIQKAFIDWALGYSGAVAMVFFVVVLIVTI